MDIPKILVIANNSFSTTEANGRTLGNFFVDWPKERLAQFALRAENPDTTRCTNYFIVSDTQALRSFKKSLIDFLLALKCGVATTVFTFCFARSSIIFTLVSTFLLPSSILGSMCV